MRLADKVAIVTGAGLIDTYQIYKEGEKDGKVKRKKGCVSSWARV